MNQFLVTIIYLLLVGSVFLVDIQASVCKSVKSINSLQLNKCVYTDLDTITSLNLDSISGFLCTTYTDENNRIRKSITKMSESEFRGFAIHYFDTKGTLIYLIIKEYSALDPSVVGTIFREGSVVEYDIQYNDDNDHFLELATDSLLYGSILATINTTTDLQLFINNCKTRQIDYKKFVTFRTPMKGETIFLNKRAVDLRKCTETDVSETVVGGLGTNLYQGVFEGNIDPFDSNCISIYIDQCRYYVSIACVEPVEITLNQ